MAQIQLLQIGIQVDVAEARIGIVVGDAALGQQFLDLLAGLQAVHQLLLQRELGHVAAGCGDAFGHRVDAGGNLRGRQLARLGDVGHVALPHIVHPEQIGFLGRRRSRVEHVRLRGGLELADLEQVHVHAELVLQAFAEVLAVTAQAFQHHRAHRVQVDLVGLRGQQVLRLAQAVAVGHDLLAGSAQVLQRRGHFAHRGETAGLQLVQAQRHALDLRIGLGRFQRADQIAQLDLLGALVAHGFGQRAADRIGAELLDQGAFRRDQQRGAVAQRLGAVATRHRKHDRQQEQQQEAEEHQVQDQPASEVHHIP